MQIANMEVILRIACAVFCGALIGWERERREKAAGLRTHVFVSMGAALVMVVSAFGFSDAVTKGLVTLDPSRVAAQVVSGIGFLGAGVIWFARNKVRGLDTAATIWTTSAVGLAAGCGMYIPALLVTCAVLVMNLLVKPMEQRFFQHSKEGSVLIGVTLAHSVEDIRRVIAEAGLKVKSVRTAQNGDSGSIGMDLSVPKGMDWLMFVGRVQSLEGVKSVSYNEPSTSNE